MHRKAILVTYKDDRLVDEAIGLAETANFEIIHIIKAKKLGIGKYGLGKGKAEEVRRAVEQLNPECVIIDERLRTGQSYNLSMLIGKEVIDREKVILDIFAMRAASPEAKLQVKLAQLLYELPRVKDIVRRSKVGEQPGPHGYGRYEVQRYIWNIRRQICVLREKLKKVATRRELHQRERRQSNIPFIALAGYTGAGKTTLFNGLTMESKEVTGKLFTTLSTTIRKFKYRGVDFFVSDTVGFIDRLPHYLIEAFKSTLEELNFADLVLLLTDVSVPMDEFERKLKVSLSVLSELAIDPSKVLIVLNKIDKVDVEEVKEKARLVPQEMAHIAISAKTGLGIENLKETIYRRVVEGAEWSIVTEEERAKELRKVAERLEPLVKISQKPIEDNMLLLNFKGPRSLIEEIKMVTQKECV